CRRSSSSGSDFRQAGRPLERSLHRELAEPNKNSGAETKSEEEARTPMAHCQAWGIRYYEWSDYCQFQKIFTRSPTKFGARLPRQASIFNISNTRVGQQR